ncbi:MAG: hypothetical protein QXV82_09615 [Ignisphaera sp.]
MSLENLLGNLLPELRKELKDYTFETIASGDEEVLVRALSKAYIWLKAKLKPCEIISINLEDEVIKQALIKRALYEIYSYAENEEVARDKAEDALEILKGYFGECVDTGKEKDVITRVPIVSYIGGSSSWKGFKEHD